MASLETVSARFMVTEHYIKKTANMLSYKTTYTSLKK